MREFSLPTVREVLPEENLTDAIWWNAADSPDHIAVQRIVGDVVQGITSVQFRDDIVGVAKGLIANGVSPGDRVALMSRTRYEWTLLDYAIWAAGAVVVPVYPTSSANQTEWILRDSGAVACVVEDNAQANIVTSLRDQLPELRHVLRLESNGDGESDIASTADAISVLQQAGADVDIEEVEARRSALSAEDLATIIYTSGTTGSPKGCRLLHRNVLFNVRNGMVPLEDQFNSAATILLFLPLAHVLAREFQCGAVITQTTMCHSPDRKQILVDLARFSPTVLLTIPLAMDRIYNGARQRALLTGKERLFDIAAGVAIAYSRSIDSGGPGVRLRIKHALFDMLLYRKLRAVFGGRCTGAFSGGSALSERLGHFFRGIGTPVYEGYGLTETVGGCTVNTTTANKIGTVGRPLPGVTIRIADDGEVLVKSKLVFDGYWNDPSATEQALDPAGWLHSGDLGELDNEGYLRITGRKKEIIVTSGGKNVAPTPLEDGLRAHPLISQCMVVGNDKPFIGCLITIDPETFETWKRLNGKPSRATVQQLRDDPMLHASIQEAVDAVNAEVSRAESIKVFRILPRDFTTDTGELTPSLKVKRAVVAEIYAADIAEIYG